MKMAWMFVLMQSAQTDFTCVGPQGKAQMQDLPPLECAKYLNAQQERQLRYRDLELLNAYRSEEELEAARQEELDSLIKAYKANDVLMRDQQYQELFEREKERINAHFDAALERFRKFERK